MSSGKIILFLGSLFIVGSLIRIIGGNALFIPDLTYSSGKKEKFSGTKTPEATAKSFYMLIDSGNYEGAWEICLEPDWTQGERVTYHDEVSDNPSIIPGWSSKEGFVSRLSQEIGHRGYGITLNNIHAQRIGQIDNSIISHHYGLDDIEDVVSILVNGQMLGACSIFKWEKSVIVLSIDGKYKVLLDGTKPQNSFFYQSWFSRIERIGNLRSSE
jgi:hypothetical protein